jgi:hypothetical protein
MFRLLIRTIIFIIAIGLSLFIGVQWKLDQDLEKISERWRNTIELTYQNARVTVSGDVVVNGVGVYFKKQDIYVSADVVKYSTDSVLDAAFLYNHSRSKALPRQSNLSVNNLVIPLTPSLVELLNQKQPPSIWTGLLATACGKVRKFGVAQYFSLGYDNASFSGDLNIEQEPMSGNLLASGWVDIENTALIEYRFNAANVYTIEDGTNNTSPASLDAIELNIEDRGFNARRNEFCSLKQTVETEEFITQHVEQVKKLFSSVGIKMLPSGRRAYTELMQPATKLGLSALPSASFSISDFGFYDEKELRSILNLELSLNNRPVNAIFEGWALDKLEQINLNQYYQDDESGLAKRFETIVIKRSYQPEPLDKIDDFIGQSVKIIRQDGREYIGKLIESDQSRLKISIPLNGGIVQVPVIRAQVTEFYVYR